MGTFAEPFFGMIGRMLRLCRAVEATFKGRPQADVGIDTVIDIQREFSTAMMRDLNDIALSVKARTVGQIAVMHFAEANTACRSHVSEEENTLSADMRTEHHGAVIKVIGHKIRIRLVAKACVVLLPSTAVKNVALIVVIPEDLPAGHEYFDINIIELEAAIGQSSVRCVTTDHRRGSTTLCFQKGTSIINLIDLFLHTFRIIVVEIFIIFLIRR